MAVKELIEVIDQFTKTTETKPAAIYASYDFYNSLLIEIGDTICKNLSEDITFEGIPLFVNLDINPDTKCFLVNKDTHRDIQKELKK